MSDHVYPIHFQRRFEQRWAARFATPSAVKPIKARKNAAKVPRRQPTIETNPIIRKAS
jgi:hypothetical protein